MRLLTLPPAKPDLAQYFCTIRSGSFPVPTETAGNKYARRRRRTRGTWRCKSAVGSAAADVSDTGNEVAECALFDGCLIEIHRLLGDISSLGFGWCRSFGRQAPGMSGRRQRKIGCLACISDTTGGKVRLLTPQCAMTQVPCRIKVIKTRQRYAAFAGSGSAVLSDSTGHHIKRLSGSLNCKSLLLSS